MLIDFTVENYRSIKTPVKLRAIATPPRSVARPSTNPARRRIIPDQEITPGFSVKERGFAVLPVLGLFGANASGKSNILSALDLLISLMMGNANPEFLAETVVPYKLSAQTVNRPTRFYLNMAAGGDLFRYKLVLDAERVWQEKLEYVPANSQWQSDRLLFHRMWKRHYGTYIWTNGEDFAGPHTEMEAELKQTDLYIYPLLKRLKIPGLQNFARLRFHWQGLHLLGEDADQHIASYLTHGTEDTRYRIIALMRSFDTGITDIEIKHNPYVVQSEEKIDLSEFEITVVHETENGPVKMSFAEESAGTRRLFALASKIILALNAGSLVLIDALGAQIHPNITHKIVRLFQNPKTNPNFAQMIFTSQESTLLQRNLLRRDQIWFTAKQEDGRTDMYPLTDFKPRNDLAIDKAYLDGRFGAVPRLPDTDMLVPDVVLTRR